MSGDEDTARPVSRIAGPDDAVTLMKLKQRLDEETSSRTRKAADPRQQYVSMNAASPNGAGWLT